MSQYVIEKPILYRDKWLVFNDTVFSDLDSIDCNDTVSGVCYENKTIDDCISLCDKERNCNSGYYIDTGNTTICVPVKDYIHKELNPSYRLRNKIIYPTLKDFTVKTFINSKKYKYPPDMANAVFFEDFFELENIKSGLRVGDIDNQATIQLEKKGTNLQFLPSKDVTEKSTIYIPVRYNIPLVIRIPSTNIVMFKENQKQLVWSSRVLSIPDQDNTFRLHSVKEQDGSYAYYGDTVYITYQNIFIIEYNARNNYLEAIHESYENAIKNNRNIFFKLIPKVENYFCNSNSNCVQINDLSKIQVNGVKSRYNGQMVTRNPACWNCPDIETLNSIHNLNSTSKTWLIIVLIILAIILGLITVWYKIR